MTPDQARSVIAQLKSLSVELDSAMLSSETAFLKACKVAQEHLYAKMTDLLAQSSDALLDDAMAWYSENAMALEGIVNGSGYYPAARAYLDGYDELAKITQGMMKKAGFDPSFATIPKEYIKFIKAHDWRHFSFLNDEALQKLEDTLLETMLAGRTRGAMLAELKGVFTGSYPWGDKKGLYEWHAGTYARTAHHRAAQSFILSQADAAGVENFIYIGPNDSKTRGFCAELVGGVYSRKEIEAMDNGQTGNVLTDRGGFNCRHQWLPASDELAAAIRKDITASEINTISPA
ncbi:MAG: hypothetical protein KOO61_08300 [Spirochaetales bacterium]|nr:hypothetical protein [Spirochaetales bacterium]